MIELKPHQIPPAGDWMFWHLVDGDRASGKTFAAAAFVRSHLTGGKRGVVIARNSWTIRDQIIPALMKIDPELTFQPSRYRLNTQNGDSIDMLSIDQVVDQPALMGRVYSVGWIEDLGEARVIRQVMENLSFSLREAPAQAVLTGNYAYPTSKATVIHRR